MNVRDGSNKTSYSDTRNWFERLGDDFYNHYTHTNDVSAGIGREGMYNLLQDAQGNSQPIQDAKQESLDGINEAKGAPLFADLMERFRNGEITALDLQSIVAQYNMRLNPYQEAWLNNMISEQNTLSDRDYQTEQRDTSLLSTYEQLQKLGMNPGSVISIGGASSGVSSQAAAAQKTNIENARFDRQTQMAKTMIGLAGGLASTGVHGAALGAARFAASKLTSEASKYATDMKYGHVKTSYYDPENKSSHTFYTY